jgi:hypothetical protein
MSKRFTVLALSVGCLLEIGCGATADPTESADPKALPTEMVTSEIVNNTHDYFFVQTPQTWPLARAYCNLTGHLVTIGDSGENEFVRAQAQQHAIGAWWIGRNDQAVETVWRWENNEALRYDNWASGEPNNFNNEDCATIDSVTGQWNDLDCNVAKTFICERDQGPVATTQNFVYSATNTNSTTQNFRLATIVSHPGSVVNVGTCGLPGASATGDTQLRIFDPTNTTEVASNDDACGGFGSNVSFIPTSINYVIRAGCFGSGTCSGTIQIQGTP